MIVMMIAITPSLNASNLPLVIYFSAAQAAFFNGPNVADDAVSFERKHRRASQHSTHADVALTTMRWHVTADPSSVPSLKGLMTPFSLRSTEIACDVKHHHIPINNVESG